MNNEPSPVIAIPPGLRNDWAPRGCTVLVLKSFWPNTKSAEAPVFGLGKKYNWNKEGT